MTVQLTVIGLDQVGVSFGLALADHKDKILRCGHDPVPTLGKKIDAENAFDKIHYRLSEAVHDADVILLSLPVDQIEETLKDMAEDLKEGVTVINVCHLGMGIVDFARKTLPSESRFITIAPSLNGAYLQEIPSDLMTPHADLFKNCEMVISTTSDTHPNAVNLATELSNLVGAHPFLTDLQEGDGIHAKIDMLPKLTSAALLLTTINQPGWQDTKRITSSPYASGTNAIQFFVESEHPAQSILTNRENALLALDGMIMALSEIRSLVDAKDQQSLDAMLLDLKAEHTEWLGQRSDGDWEKTERAKIEKPAGGFRRLFGDPSRLFKK